jgi:hypothetical protein
MMQENGSSERPKTKKWQTSDIVVLIVQIVFPLVAIIINWRIPSGAGTGQIPDDAKLSIIGLGLLVPLILNQISITNGQNRSDFSLREMEKKIAHINPILEKAFMSGNDRILRFALRRMKETNKVISSAIYNKRSDKLLPRDYYDELEHFAHLIMTDKTKKGEEFTGEIWAMTSFALDEWINDDGYEKRWVLKLNELVDMGIVTKRLCIVPQSLWDVIDKDLFDEAKAKTIPQFPGFIKLMQYYYGVDAKRNIAHHYIIKDTTDPDLRKAAGFFAIKLTDGELHILTDETVDEYGSIRAEALFEDQEIKSFRKRCEGFMNPNYSLEKIIKKHAKPDGFLKYLQNNGINI